MSTDLDVAIAAELRAELGRQMRSKRSMAAALALPPSTVNRWLNGTTPFSISELDAMCRVLDVTIPDLLARVEPDSHTPTGGYFSDSSQVVRPLSVVLDDRVYLPAVA
jgi:hypothetical protein